MFGKAAPIAVLRCAVIFFAGLICTTTIAEKAAAADLRIPAPPKPQATPASAPSTARLYDQFIKWLQTHPRED